MQSTYIMPLVINPLGGRYAHTHKHTHTQTHTHIHMPTHEPKQFQGAKHAPVAGVHLV